MSKIARVNKKVKSIFYYAGYARKSSEEEDSRSVRNQISVIEAEFRRIIENDEVNEYVRMGMFVDEDYSGTDSQRPDFQKLLKLIDDGKINMLMVTDLSRLSRNLSESIDYVQGVFVASDIRFISTQLPELDSFLQPEKVYSLEIPMHSMVNENHCAETSFKVRRTFNRLRKNGQFIGAFAGYGWKKDSEDKHKLILDEEPYQVLRSMRDWLLNGDNAGIIARKLNERGIPNPSTYKKINGSTYHNTTENCSEYWSSNSVRKVLSRPENVGDLIQGRTRKKSYKIHKNIQTSPEEWFVCEDRIPAIFTRDEQEQIMNVLQRSARVSPNNKAKEVYLFSGFLKCPDCGKSVVRKSSNQYVYYMCNTYKNYHRGCTKHSIRHELLEEAVLTSIQKQIEIAVDLNEVMKKVEKAPFLKNQRVDYDKLLLHKEKDLANISKFKKSLYEDLKSEIITLQEYKEMKLDYHKQEEQLKATRNTIQQEMAKMNTACDNPFITTFLKYKNVKKLTRELLLALVDKIYIHEGKAITIIFKFEDEYQKLRKSLENNSEF